MTVRFFAGYDLDTNRIIDNNLIEYLYANAETMGADLDGIGQQTPSFFVWAVRDAFTYSAIAKSSNHQRLHR
jgi:hypothetical protein